MQLRQQPPVRPAGRGVGMAAALVPHKQRRSLKPGVSWVLLAVAAVVCRFPAARAGLHLEGCGDKKIAVLDLDSMFRDEARGRPACFPDTLMVVPSSGKVYVANNLTRDAAPHAAGLHAAAWHTAEALRRSENFTPDLDQADLIFVNDYCYMTWWLGWLNFQALTNARTGPEDPTPGDFLVAAYDRLGQTPRWHMSGGADFIFFDGHPGFYEGAAKQQVWPMRCGAQRRAVQILAGLSQRRRCGGFQEQRAQLVVAPLMAPVTDPLDTHIFSAEPASFWARAHAELAKQAVPVPLEERNILLLFKGRCDPHAKGAGLRLRAYLARSVFRSPPAGVEVQCLEDLVPPAGVELFEASASHGEARRARFCLVLPGQEQATNAVAEAFLAGCVPVFVGPPWHSMPLASAVDYQHTAVFVRLQDTAAYLDQEMAPEEDGGAHAGAHPHEARFWTPDIPAAELDGMATTLRSGRELLGHLKALERDKGERGLAARLAAVWRERGKFLYHGADEGELPGAVQAVMAEVCARTAGPGRPRVDWAKRDIDDPAASVGAREGGRTAAQQAQDLNRTSVLNILA